MSQERIQRCYTNNIYLIEAVPPNSENDTERAYVIMGHSGHVYNVTITNYPSCTCPDYYLRGNRCKHIYFVLMRIMNITNATDDSFSDEELIEMYRNIPPITQNLMYKGEAVEVEGKEVDQKFDAGDICPICLDPLENGQELDFCRFSCGKTIHKKCFSMWEKSKGSICVFCRAKWYSNNIIKYHKKVSMHPIESINENIDKNNKSQNTLTDKDINKEEKKDIINKDEDNKKIKKERRYRSRSRNRSRSKKEHLNINRKSKSY
jgi:hypothetical protein